MVDFSRENRIEVLRQGAVLLERENARLSQRIQTLIAENAELKNESPEQLQAQLIKLQEELELSRRAQFGDRSERRPNRSEGPVEAKKPREHHGPTEQRELRALDEVHDLDEADTVCPKCGGELTEMKEQFEESEEIDVLEREWVVVKHKRKKYRCACNACVETAPGPVKLRPGNRYSLNFAIAVVLSKYCDHIPLERQVRIMRREGLKVTSQVLWDQVWGLYTVLRPLHDTLHAHVLSQPVIGADETWWRLMGAKKSDSKANKRWTVWALCATDSVVYRLKDSRSGAAASEVLGEYDGIVMADGYSVYVALGREGGLVVIHCWAHVRRKFVEAAEFYPAETEPILDLIGELYAVEREAKDKNASLEQLGAIRAEKSKPILKRIEAWAMEVRPLPESALGKAVSYMAKLWPGLTRFADDPRIPLDNNATERSLRNVVVGRKNHYGSRSKRGTEAAALFYSLVESARLAGVEPRAFLREAATAALEDRAIPLPHEIA